MRSGIALAVLFAVAVIGLGLVTHARLTEAVEIVPREPSFGERDRVASDGALRRPYGDDRPSLRELAEEAGILIGAAIEPEDMAWEPLYNPLVAREFSVVTTENSLKFGLVRKSANRYVFGAADAIVDFAVQNGLQVRGHTLVWHEEVPGWLKTQDLDREELSALLKTHIETLVGRYEGRIHYWDVLNEAVDYDGSLRDTIWLEKLGPEYMDDIFH